MLRSNSPLAARWGGFGLAAAIALGLLLLGKYAGTTTALTTAAEPIAAAEQPNSGQPPETDAEEPKKLEIATLGGGCFWCVEGAMEILKGVDKVVSGYEGGFVKNPTYEQVCSKRTGHVEVCQIHFDPEVISFDDLLEVFFKIHDPTTKNRQGNDVGPQYRSVIFYHSESQQKQALQFIAKLNESGVYGRSKIVTDVEPTKVFYEAEAYHQDYFAKNPFAGYCQAIVKPKVDKVNKEFSDKVKRD